MPASAASHALGLSHCRAAPWSIVGRAAAAPASSSPASDASFHAMYSRKTTPAQRTTAVTWGHVATTSCSPSPASTSSRQKPAVAPVTWARVAANPWRAPLPRATTLTGPGEIEVARAKAAIEANMLICVSFRVEGCGRG
jgi:hypothetical protein